MNAWLSAPRSFFKCSISGKVLELQGPAAVTSRPVASVRKISLQRASPARRQPVPAPASAPLSVFLFPKDLEGLWLIPLQISYTISPGESEFPP